MNENEERIDGIAESRIMRVEWAGAIGKETADTTASFTDDQKTWIVFYAKSGACIPRSSLRGTSGSQCTLQLFELIWRQL